MQMRNLAFRGLRLPRLGAMRGGGGAVAPLPDIASAVYWGDASDASTISATSGKVSEWRDRNGGTNKFVQGTAASRPETGTQTINGLNALQFTGGVVSLESPNFMSTSTHTLMFVIEAPDDDWILMAPPAGGQAILVSMSGNTFPPNTNIGSAITSVGGVNLSPDTRVGLEAATTGSVCIAMVENANMSNLSSFVLGEWTTGTGLSYRGKLGSFVAMIAPTTAEKNTVGNYLSAQWGAAWVDRA